MSKWWPVIAFSLLSTLLTASLTYGKGADRVTTAPAELEAEPAGHPRSGDDLVVRLMSGLEGIVGAIDTAAPVIRAEGKKMWAEIQQEVDGGFLQLSRLTNDVDRIASELETELQAALGDIDLERISAFLDSFETNVVDFAVSAMADRALEALDIDPGKIAAVGDILGADIRRRGRMLDTFLSASGENIDAYQGQNAKLWSETLGQLEALLTQEQRDRLTQWQAGSEQRIHALVAEKKANAAPNSSE